MAQQQPPPDVHQSLEAQKDDVNLWCTRCQKGGCHVIPVTLPFHDRQITFDAIIWTDGTLYIIGKALAGSLNRETFNLYRSLKLWGCPLRKLFGDEIAPLARLGLVSSGNYCATLVPVDFAKRYLSELCQRKGKDTLSANRQRIVTRSKKRTNEHSLWRKHPLSPTSQRNHTRPHEGQPVPDLTSGPSSISLSPSSSTELNSPPLLSSNPTESPPPLGAKEPIASSTSDNSNPPALPESVRVPNSKTKATYPLSTVPQFPLPSTLIPPQYSFISRMRRGPVPIAPKLNQVLAQKAEGASYNPLSILSEACALRKTL